MALPGLRRRIPKKYMNNDTLSSPRPVWYWHVFGKDGIAVGSHSLMLVQVTFPVPLWRRILTRVLLGSVWERCPVPLLTVDDIEDMSKRDWTGAEL